MIPSTAFQINYSPTHVSGTYKWQKVSVSTSQTTMTDQLIQFREIIAVYCENHAKHVHTLYG